MVMTITSQEGDKEMRDIYKGTSIIRHTLIRSAGGIGLITLALAVIMNLLCFKPASAQLESQCRMVSPGKCAECHPKNKIGECNLVSDHTFRVKANCVSCHTACTDLSTPPFDHFQDVCMTCHVLTKVHKKHASIKNNAPQCITCHGKKILIVVDSKHGSTARYADLVGEELCANGFQVDIGLAHKMQNFNVSGYDGYIIGSPTYWGYPLKDLRSFLATNAETFETKPTAYLYCSLENAQTGNVSAQAFWRFAYYPELSKYNDAFHLAEVLQAQLPPNGLCDTTFNPRLGVPNYTNCSAPAWVGLMPGSWIPRNGYPVEYMPMEIFGFGGFKPYFREGAAVEYAQALIDIGFFDGACTPGNRFPTVTASGSPTSGNQPLQVSFTATASDPDGTITSYFWSFGDGSTSEAQNPSHTYSCSGTFNAKVQVTDNNCGIAVATVAITVNDIGGPPTFDCSVAPVFQKYCNECHGSAGGLSTRTCEGLQAGGNSGPVIDPGSKETSLLYQTMTGGSPIMPPSGTTGVPQADKDKVGAWIDSLTDPSCAVDFCNPPCAPF